MSDEVRNWREAKIPQWAKDSIDAEMRNVQLTAALAWPTEAKPSPVSFQWGGYDHLRGQVVPGTYWNTRCDRIEIAARESIPDNERPSEKRWEKWLFRRNGREWSASVERGPLFPSEREARLYALWQLAEDCAFKLMMARERLA